MRFVKKLLEIENFIFKHKKLKLQEATRVLKVPKEKDAKAKKPGFINKLKTELENFEHEIACRATKIRAGKAIKPVK